MEYWIIRDVSDKEPQEIAIKLPIALNANEAAKAIEYGNTLKSKSKPPFMAIAAIMKNIIAEKLVNELKKYTPRPLFLLYIFFSTFCEVFPTMIQVK
jgi:hypothetical protein